MSRAKRCRAEKCRQTALTVYTLPGGAKVGLCLLHGAYMDAGITPPLKPHVAAVSRGVSKTGGGA